MCPVGRFRTYFSINGQTLFNELSGRHGGERRLSYVTTYAEAIANKNKIHREQIWMEMQKIWIAARLANVALWWSNNQLLNEDSPPQSQSAFT
jgi:hypothetical protein